MSNSLSNPLLKLIARMIGCFTRTGSLEEMTAIVYKVLEMRQRMTGDQWVKLALEVNKVIDVTAMISIEGTARDLAVAWIKEAAAITA